MILNASLIPPSEAFAINSSAASSYSIDCDCATNLSRSTISSCPIALKSNRCALEIIAIISRAQRFDFKAIGHDEIVERLRFVAQSQSIEYDDAALEFIAKASEGGMRDALSIIL